MNFPLFIIFGIGVVVVGYLFMKELFGKPTPKTTKRMAYTQPQPLPQQPSTQQPKKNFKEAYDQVQREMIAKKKQELISPQAITHSAIPREYNKTVDTDFQQAQTTMFSMTPLKQPINPEEMDLKKDAFRYWCNKQPTIYALLAVISLILFFLMGV